MSPVNGQRNALLAALPGPEREVLMGAAQHIELNMKDSLYEPNKEIKHAYFPLSGVCSIVMILEHGAPTEIATVGNEGMIGLPAFLGARSVPGRAFVQVPGEALRMGATKFRQSSRNGVLHQMMHRYAQALFNQVSYSVACLRQHSTEQRASRWLLMTHDRVDGDVFPLTQEFLGQMLGVRRMAVSESAAQLQREGLISYVRGVITIKDRNGLEKRSCECYAIVRKEYQRLLNGNLSRR